MGEQIDFDRTDNRADRRRQADERVPLFGRTVKIGVDVDERLTRLVQSA